MDGEADCIDALSLDKAQDLFESRSIDRVEAETGYEFFGNPYKFLGCGFFENPV